MYKNITQDEFNKLSPKAQRKLRRRLQSDADMVMHKATPSLSQSATISKLKKD